MDFLKAFEEIGRAGRQAILDKLGELYGLPYRPYTIPEWKAAYEAVCGPLGVRREPAVS